MWWESTRNTKPTRASYLRYHRAPAASAPFGSDGDPRCSLIRMDYKTFCILVRNGFLIRLSRSSS